METYLSNSANLLNDLMKGGSEDNSEQENVENYIENQKNAATIFGPKRDFVRVSVQKEEEEVEPEPVAGGFG